MSAIRLIRHRDLKPTPWKNGGGETREIAAFPPGAGLEDFVWRISMATVASDGPFSAFPGIDRVLTVVDGDGIDLMVDGISRTLTPNDPPFAFAGDAPAAARLIGSVVTDINVMTRRGRCTARVSVLSGQEALVTSQDEVVILLSRSDGLEVIAEGQQLRLDRFDSLIGGAGTYRLEAGSKAADALVIELKIAD
ncbi:HutD/Ves family protein [Oryzibacter oryziterrae]|uniref:HutD/Ves family protein n=1 Tax=Oryzibacter oryziterrae TaxID=2766474 RepID=UPI001F185F82|nr:HutD family protein [Oryzibacter oryziterrae]